MENSNGTFINVNDRNLIAEVSRNINSIKESVSVLNSNLQTCEHFKINLGPNIIKEIVLLENQIGKVG